MNVYAINWSNCYSLWSYRNNLIKYINKNKSKEDVQVFQREQIKRVQDWLINEKNQNNECAWNYLTGFALSASYLRQDQLIAIYNFAKLIFEKNPTNRFAGNTCLQFLQHLN